MNEIACDVLTELAGVSYHNSGTIPPLLACLKSFCAGCHDASDPETSLFPFKVHGWVVSITA